MAKKETGQQRRMRLIKAGICTACAKRKPQRKSKANGGGFYTECRACRAYYSDWAKSQAAKPKTKEVAVVKAVKAVSMQAVGKAAKSWTKFKTKRQPVLTLPKAPAKMPMAEVVRDLTKLVNRGVVQVSGTVH